MTDREKFETWYSDFSGQSLEWVFSQRDGDRYCVGRYVQGYWLCYQAALASQQPADDGWIEWQGDIDPLDEPVRGIVEVKFKDGSTDIGGAAKWYWAHDGDNADIIAYRVVKP